MINRNININEREIDVEKRTVRFVISTETMDRHGTIIKVGGWKLDNYERNPVVLYGHASHSSNPDHVIGTGRVWVEGDKLWGEATLEEADVNELADKVFRKLQSGTLRAVSVGFDPKSYRWGAKDHGENEDAFYYVEQELIEFSVVPVGSNPDTLQKSIEAINRHKKEVRKLDEKSKPDNLAQRRKNIVDAEDILYPV